MKENIGLATKSCQKYLDGERMFTKKIYFPDLLLRFDVKGNKVRLILAQGCSKTLAYINKRKVDNDKERETRKNIRMNFFLPK